MTDTDIRSAQHTKEKAEMRHTFNACGWSTLAVAAFATAASYALSALLGALDSAGVGAISFFGKYYLVFNELLVGASLIFGSLLLLDLPTAAPTRKSISFKSFFVPFCICFPIATVGSNIGNLVTELGGLFTSGETSDGVTALLASTDTFQMFVCVGIVAPIIEEFFFRKLLIDRIYRYGEFSAVFISGLLFGLFHQNYEQFFYTAGVGMVFALVYCRTGSYSLVVLLHLAFNMVLGVLPMLLSADLTEILELISSEAFTVERLLAMLGSTWISVVVYCIYLLFTKAIEVAGVILLVKTLKKLRFQRGDTLLTSEEKRSAAVLNGGMLAVIGVLSTYMQLSL